MNLIFIARIGSAGEVTRGAVRQTTFGKMAIIKLLGKKEFTFF